MLGLPLERSQCPERCLLQNAALLDWIYAVVYNDNEKDPNESRTVQLQIQDSDLKH